MHASARCRPLPEEQATPAWVETGVASLGGTRARDVEGATDKRAAQFKPTAVEGAIALKGNMSLVACEPRQAAVCIALIQIKRGKNAEASPASSIRDLNHWLTIRSSNAGYVVRDL